MAEQVWPPGARTEAMREKIPLGRFGKPAEVADAVLFLLLRTSSLGCQVPLPPGRMTRR